MYDVNVEDKPILRYHITCLSSSTSEVPEGNGELASSSDRDKVSLNYTVATFDFCGRHLRFSYKSDQLHFLYMDEAAHVRPYCGVLHKVHFINIGLNKTSQLFYLSNCAFEFTKFKGS